VVRTTSFWRDRLLDLGAFFRRAAERRSVPMFLSAGFPLRGAFFFLAMRRSLSLGPAIHASGPPPIAAWSAAESIHRQKADTSRNHRNLRIADAHFTAPIVTRSGTKWRTTIYGGVINHSTGVVLPCNAKLSEQTVRRFGAGRIA
jgi:hypothetical protein